MSKKIKIEFVPVDQLSPAGYNPRMISDDMKRKLKKGILEFGLVDPLIINKDNTVIGGHQRLTVINELIAEGITKIETEDGTLDLKKAPCIRLHLDEKKEKALNLALNKISGEWRYDKLTELLTELSDFDDFDIETTGFDEIEITDLTTLDTDGPTFGGSPSLLDIYNSETEVQGGNTMNPGQVVIASMGSFIQGFKRGQFSSEENYDRLRTLVDELQVEGSDDEKTAIAVKLGEFALGELDSWYDARK